jgi:putative flavoprotein involved in K+ transport
MAAASPVLIVGAGPAGLAVAGTLRRQGQDPVVLEQAAEIGSSWAGRWKGLRLHTMRALSGLPGAPIPRRYGRWVSRADFVAYLRGYAEQFGIEPELGVRATRIERERDGWRVSTSPTTAAGTPTAPGARRSSGEDRRVSRVVVATGYSRAPFIPAWPGRDVFTPPLTHSLDYREPAPYKGQRVLVVGCGNSGAEIATELAQAGAVVRLAVRTPPNIVRRSSLGVPSQLVGLALRRAPAAVMDPASALLRRLSVPDLTDHGLPAPPDGFTQFLRTRTVPVLDHGFVDQVRAGRITIVSAVDRLTEDLVLLADGRRVSVDAVICATGFVPALEPLVGHLGVLGADGLPRVRGGQTHPDAPGLHFVGITVELSGLLHEIGVEARDLGRVLARGD